jgi:hypothetical protein
MIPNYYECSSCRERFEFGFREAYYYLGSGSVEGSALDEALLSIPVRPGWCKNCGSVCIVEDIAPLRTFEAAYGAVRQGRPVEYPVATEYCEPEFANELAGAYLRWRLGRRHAARALCCGGSDYIFMDDAQPLIKHAECDFGFIEPMVWIGSYCGTGPGVRSPANLRLYTSEGELAGLLTWHHRGEGRWDVAPSRYPPPGSDD